MWSYALFIWTAVWKMISPLMISRKTAAHPTFTFCIALVIMTFFIPNKSHQLLKIRAVYSGGAGGVRAPPEFRGSKKGKVCLLSLFSISEFSYKLSHEIFDRIYSRWKWGIIINRVWKFAMYICMICMSFKVYYKMNFWDKIDKMNLVKWNW